jgi:hypothetical protein
MLEGLTTALSPRGNESGNLFGASPRERVPGAAVSVIVDDATVALEAHFAARRSQSRAVLDHGAGVEPALPAPL